MPFHPLVRVIASPALALTILVGCYRTVPIELAAVTPGTPVRVQLTAVGQDRLRQEQQPGAGRETLLGKFVRNGADSVVIGLESTVMEANVRARTFYSDVNLLRSDIRAIGVRRLDRRRTTAVAVAMGAGAIMGVVLALEYGGKSTGSLPPGGGTPEQRIPFGIRFAIP